MLSEWSQLLRNHLLSTHLLVASRVPGRECGWRMSKRWVRHSACAPGTHSLMKAGTLACWQVVPGISYGIMTGKEEKEHLESPGDTFNLVVLPTSTRRFFSARSPAPLLPSFPCPPTVSSWPVESGCWPVWGLWPLLSRMSHFHPPPHTEQCPLLERNRNLQIKLKFGLIYLFILKRLKSENSYLNINGFWHSFLKHKDTVNF